MNKAIVVTTWRYMVHSPLRLLMFGLFLLASHFVIRSLGESGLGGLSSIWIYLNIFGNLLVWTLGAGLIRNDRTSGVLALVLLRPLSRAQYVFSKWLALTAACWAVAALVALLGLAYLPVSTLGAGSLGEALAALLLLTASASAILTLISALPLGFGDLGLLALFLLGDWIILLYGSSHALAWMDSLSSFVFRVLVPHYAAPTDLSPGVLPEMALQCGAGVAALLGAVWFTQRLELNYGEAN